MLTLYGGSAFPNGIERQVSEESIYTYSDDDAAKFFEESDNESDNKSDNESDNKIAFENQLEEVKQNREWLKKDAAMQFEVAQIVASGPNWRDGVLDQQEAAAGAMPAAGGPAMGASGTGVDSPATASAAAPAEGESPSATEVSSAETSALPT